MNNHGLSSSTKYYKAIKEAVPWNLPFSIRGELQASESRFQTQRRIALALQAELLQLYSRLETEDSSTTASASPAEGAAETRSSTETRYEQTPLLFKNGKI